MKKYIYTSAIAVLLILVLITCKKDVETPSGSNKIDVGQTLADSVSYFYSQIKTTITDLNGNAIKEHGHCWSTIQKPTIEGNRSQLGELNQAATFTSELNDLEDNTKYYVRYYLTLENGTVYGEDMQFSTLKAGVPDVEISAVSEIDLYSGKFQGTVLADSGAAVQSKGFCWHTQENFSIDDCLDTTVNGSGLGAFSSQISNLSEGTTYYVKSYAINQKGISYSLTESFITVAITVPGLRTINVENITNNQATIHAEVLNNGLGSITARGVCWHTQPNFNIDNNSGFNVEEGGLGEFSSIITNLNGNTTYYAKAFATNEKGTAYGEVLEFKTSTVSIPQVSTNEVTGITINSADGGGVVISDGYSSVTARGVVWSTTENPTIENNNGITSDGQGMGAFSSHLTNLTYGTSYFVRAYAVNNIGVAYGEQKSFETLAIVAPTVSTNEVTNITVNSAESGGNVTNDGNGVVTEKGVCWSFIDNPTIGDNKTDDGSGLGEFESFITELEDGITYYVRAYAINEIGAAYGNVIAFQTLEPACGGETSFYYGGQTYDIIEVGSQCWMAENLNIGNRINGNLEMTDNNVKEKYCYSNNESNCDQYGGLYQWDEMMQYTTQEGAQGICPNGWHIPTDDEWKIMEMLLGMSQSEANDTGWRGTDEGGKMKETGTAHWYSPNTGAANTIGFTALPGGYINSNGSFSNLGYYGHWWSATESSGSYAWYRSLYYDNDQVSRRYDYKTYGRSVRCIKN